MLTGLSQVKVYYGDLVDSDDLAEKLKGRHFQLDWEMAPQPIEVRAIRCDECSQG